MKHASCITASLLLLLVCFLFMPLGIVRAEGWYWLLSDSKYSKYFEPSSVYVTHSAETSHGSVATEITAWTKTTYSYEGAKETLDNYGLSGLLPDPAHLSYSLAEVAINPQNRTILYTKEDFYNPQGAVIWSKVDGRVKEITSQQFDEAFYDAIVDSVFGVGEVDRASAKDRWLTLYSHADVDGTQTHVTADTTTMRMKGDNLVFWQWSEHKDADGNVTFAGQSPEAQLAIFKVFSDSTNGASTDTILAALNDALLLDVDVINMSLGSNGGFGREAEGDLTTKYYDLVKASGILLNCSAGNSYSSSQGGAHGDFTSVSDPDTGIISSSSSYDAALSVASVNANETAAFLIGEGRVPYNDVSGHSFTQLLLGSETSKTYEYVMVPNNGDVADYQGLDVTGKIAVVMRGGLSFEQKQLNAAAAGAAGCVIYNNRDGYLLNMSVENYKIPTVCISLSNGQMMANETEKKLTVSSTEKGYVAMSDFSSWGPLPSLSLKPEITAPGGNIYSSLPFAQYGYMSGTSMASPYLAGVAAAALEYVNTLLPGASDTDKQILVNRLLMSTANVLYDEEGVAYSPRKQGSGMVNLAAATTTPAYLYVRGQEKTKIELGDDADQLGVYKLSFVVKNLTGSALSYDVNTQVQTESTTTAGLYIAQKGYVLSADTSAIKVSGGSLSGATVTVPAKGETTVTVTVRLSDADREYLA